MDVKARTFYMPGNDVGEHGVKISAHKFVIVGMLQERADGLEEPQRRIDSVVFRSLAGVGKAIRQHPLIDMPGKHSEDTPGDVRASDGQSQPRESNHGVSPPTRD